MLMRFATFAYGLVLVLFFMMNSMSIIAADEEKDSGFNSLFNGKNLDGWKIESNGKFSVQDGLLVLSQGSGWLRSDEEYGDFILNMDFRFLEKNANSGIFFRTRETSKDDEFGWPDRGYQVQCMDIIEGMRPCGSVLPYGGPPFTSETDLLKLTNVYKPTGQWNTYEIMCVGESLRVKLNGKLITKAENIKHLRGHIGIQGEFGNLHFRNIKIKLLR